MITNNHPLTIEKTLMQVAVSRLASGCEKKVGIFSSFIFLLRRLAGNHGSRADHKSADEPTHD